MNELQQAYQVKDKPFIQLGGIILKGALLPHCSVNLVLKSFNRHGLIAGATGSGKTKTIQVLTEQLSLVGVPSLVMDIKGDISGLAAPGVANDSLLKRCQQLDIPFTPRAFPVEMLTLNEEELGVPIRASVDEFGALLFSRILDLNPTQAGVVTILYTYAQEKKLPLVDLADFKALLQFVISEEGKKEIELEFGTVSSATTSIILRKIIELEAQGGKYFFGKPSFTINTLVRHAAENEGIISILRLMNMQEYPKLFSTFMLKLLSDIYSTLPEIGDPDKPVLVLFIDEAHLIFDKASKPLLELLNTIVKLIRSKGVGLVFCTQTANDIPESILSQLGFKIQHALRAFTAKDRLNIKLVAQNFPLSSDYNTEQLLTSLAIGDALVCALDEKGQPTPLVQCRVRPPCSRMGVLSEAEVQTLVSQSPVVHEFKQRQIQSGAAQILHAQTLPPEVKVSAPKEPSNTNSSVFSSLSKNTLFRQLVRQLFRQLTTTLLKILKGTKK
jgi:DNA helicase HerA-like ATPase